MNIKDGLINFQLEALENINAKIFGDMVISLPPRYYQDFVVNILDSLERKVKINKQMVANLEELSQILLSVGL